jgi:hypothetical protein
MIPDVRIIRHHTLQGAVEPNLLAFLVLHIIRQCPTWATHVCITVHMNGLYVTAMREPGETMLVHVWDN